MKLTFTNTFHNTEASVVVNESDLAAITINSGLRLSDSTSRRLQSKICGHPDNNCRCRWGMDDSGKYEIRLHQDTYNKRVWPVFEIIPAMS